MASQHHCKICLTESNNFVLRKVSEKGHNVVYYTYPSKVTHPYSADDIITHYHHMLHDKLDKSWLWVFDGSRFDTDHIMELKTGIGISELLNAGYVKTLKEIVVINPTVHLKVLLKVINPFMSDEIKSKIRVLDDKLHSVFEFI